MKHPTITKLTFNMSQPTEGAPATFRILDFDSCLNNNLFTLLQSKPCVRRTKLIENFNARDGTPNDFLKRHRVNPHDRGRLIDWMIEVMSSYSHSPSTFFLSIAIVDSFYNISKKFIYIPVNTNSTLTTQNDLHGVGVTAMFIASKLLGIVPLSLENMQSISHNQFSKE